MIFPRNTDKYIVLLDIILFLITKRGNFYPFCLCIDNFICKAYINVKETTFISF